MSKDNFILAKLAIVSLTGCPQARRTAKALAHGAQRVPGVSVRIIANNNGPSRIRYAMSRYSRQHCSATLNQAPPVTTQQSLTSVDAVLFGLFAPDDTIAGRVRAFSELLGALWSEDALDAQLTGAYFLDDKTPIHYSDESASDDASSTKSTTTTAISDDAELTTDNNNNNSKSRKNSTASSTTSLSQSSASTPVSLSNNPNDDGAFTLLTYWSKQHQAVSGGLLNSAPVSRASSMQSRSRPRSFPDANHLAVPSSTSAADKPKRNSISSDSDYTLASNAINITNSSNNNSLEQAIEDRGEQFARQLIQLKMTSVNSAIQRRFNTMNGNFTYPSGSRSTSVSRHASTASTSTRSRSVQLGAASRSPISEHTRTEYNSSHQQQRYAKLTTRYQSSKLSPTTAVCLSNDTHRLLSRSTGWEESTTTRSDSCLSTATSSKQNWRGIRKVFRYLARYTMG